MYDARLLPLVLSLVLFIIGVVLLAPAFARVDLAAATAAELGDTVVRTVSALR